MASRRPSVPKAQFTAGISPAATKSATPRTTPGPGSSADPVTEGGPASSKAKVRRTASAPAHNNRQSNSNSTNNPVGGVAEPVPNSPVPARSFSGRLLVLGLAMGAVTLLLAPNVHTYMEQRAEISALQLDIANKQVQQDSYQSELQRWDDPAYVKQQARDRVSMLMPGETGYWVYGANGVEDSMAGSSEAAKAAAASATTAKNATALTVEPWVDSLWTAVQKSAAVQATPAAPAKPSKAPATPAPTAP